MTRWDLCLQRILEITGARVKPGVSAEAVTGSQARDDGMAAWTGMVLVKLERNAQPSILEELLTSLQN